MNILLVVRDTAALTLTDTTLRNRLQATLGHTVTLADDNDPAPSLAGTQAVVISPTSNNNNIAAKYDNAPCGVMSMAVEPHSAFVLGGYASDGAAVYDFDVIAPGDPLVAGIVGTPVNLLTTTPATNYTYFDDTQLSAQAVTVLRRGTERSVLARTPQGATAPNGVRLPTRRVFFTPAEGWPELFSADAWTIFANIITYIGAMPGQFPTANAGADQEVEVNDVVQLNGAASSDADGLIQAYAWRVISTTGPSVVLSNPNIVNPTFVAPNTACTIVLGLQVTDNHTDQLKSLEDTVRIDVISHLVVRFAQGGTWVEKPVYAAKSGSWY